MKSGPQKSYLQRTNSKTITSIKEGNDSDLSYPWLLRFHGKAGEYIIISVEK